MVSCRVVTVPRDTSSLFDDLRCFYSLCLQTVLQTMYLKIDNSHCPPNRECLQHQSQVNPTAIPLFMTTLNFHRESPPSYSFIFGYTGDCIKNPIQSLKISVLCLSQVPQVTYQNQLEPKRISHPSFSDQDRTSTACHFALEYLCYEPIQSPRLEISPSLD